MQRPDNPCYTCRRRHIQCDQSQKPCLKCVRGGLECLDKRPLTWVKGVAIRGKMRGVTFKDNATPTTTTTTTPTSQAGVAQTQTCADAPTLPMRMEDPMVLSSDRATRYYLDYYNDRICKLFIVYDSQKNPFRTLTSLAVDDPVLTKAIVALAARHKANNSHHFLEYNGTASLGPVQADKDALGFKHQAIKALSQALQEQGGNFCDTTVASVFLLIFLDLIESGSDQWNFHLEGAKRLMAMIQPRIVAQGGAMVDPGRTIQGIRDFITNQIYLIETLGSTFVRPKLLSQFTFLDQPDSLRQEKVEESFLGCPEILLNAVQCLSIQRDAIADRSATENEAQVITSVLDCITNFDCHAWAAGQAQPAQSSVDRNNNLHILSRSYQIGALLYGECILAAIQGKTVSHDSLVDELIAVIDALKEDTDLFKCILWPIFVAGLECRSPFQRSFLITCLDIFWSYTSCFNVINAAKILQGYWQREADQTPSTSQWVFEIGNLGHDWLLI